MQLSRPIARNWLLAAGIVVLIGLSASGGAAARGLGSSAVWLVVFYFAISESTEHGFSRRHKARRWLLVAGFALLLVTESFLVAHIARS